MTKLLIIALACLGAAAQEFIPFYGAPSGSPSFNGLLETNLVNYTFNEASGDAIDQNSTFVTDFTTDDLTAVGTISRTTGILGSAAVIDAGECFYHYDDDFRDAFQFHYDNSTDGNVSTLAIWVKLGTLSGDQTIMGMWGDGGIVPGSQWRLYYDDAATDVWALDYIDDGIVETITVTPSFAISTSVWTLLVVTYDDNGPGGAISLNARPVGGSWVSTTQAITVLQDAQFPFRIGGSDDGSLGLSPNERLSGASVDEFSYWRIAVTSCQMDKLFNNGSGLPFTSFDLSACTP